MTDSASSTRIPKVVGTDSGGGFSVIEAQELSLGASPPSRIAMANTYDVESVTSQATFVRFVELLLDDWRTSDRTKRAGPTPSKRYGPPADGWENATLERFLEALAAYAGDAALPEQPSWRTFAQVLAAAKIYE